MMERVAATRSIVVVLVLVVVSSLFALSLARRAIDQLPGDAEGSASSLQTLASPNLLLLLPRGQSDPDPDKRTNLEEAAAAAAEEEDDPAALAVPDRRLPDADLEAPRSSNGAGAGGDAASLLAAAVVEEEEENAVAGAEADRSSAEVMGWIPKEEEGVRAKKRGKKKKKKRGKKPCDSDSDPDSDSDDEEEEDEGEAKKKMEMMKKKNKKKGKGGFLGWFWRLVNRF